MKPREQDRSRALLGNHQNSWLWGTVPVWETLAAGIWPIHELIFSTSAGQPIHDACRELAEQKRIPVREESGSRLEQLCKSRDHQGILALMGLFPYRPVSELSEPPVPGAVLLLLDRVQDPFNLGAIIRTAAAFGIRGTIIGRPSQVGVTSHVARSSAGAVNHLPIFQVDDLHSTLRDLKSRGWQPLGARMEGSFPVQKLRAEPRFAHAPIILLIGNEATGLAPELLAECVATVCIPMSGPVESLNAAVAASILLFSLATNAS